MQIQQGRFLQPPRTWLPLCQRYLPAAHWRYAYNCTAAVAPATMAVAAARPEMAIGQVFSNDVTVTNVYTLGKMPIEYGAPTVIQANVKNVGTVTMNSISVALNITGNNTFTDNQVIPS